MKDAKREDSAKVGLSDAGRDAMTLAGLVEYCQMRAHRHQRLERKAKLRGAEKIAAGHAHAAIVWVLRHQALTRHTTPKNDPADSEGGAK